VYLRQLNLNIRQLKRKRLTVGHIAPNFALYGLAGAVPRVCAHSPI
jgi:hypothetical protein